MADNVFIIQDDVTQTQYTFRLSNGKLLLEPYGEPDDRSGILVTMNWPVVHELVNGQDVDAATFNKPITELSERTTYLYDKLRTFNRNNPLATLIMTDARLAGVNTPSVGDFVYLDTATEEFKKAAATESVFDAFTLSDSAYTSGVVVKREGMKATIVLAGRLDMASNGLSVDNMLDADEKFRPGVYFLSSENPGKMTAFPNGPRIMLGMFTGGDFAMLNIHAKDFGDSHVHRSYLLAGVPAGEQILTEDGPGGEHKYTGHSPEQFAANGNPDGRVYPRLVFTGEWLLDDLKSYNFVLQSAGGSTAPDSRFSDRSRGVYLGWSRGDGVTGDPIKITAFNKPVEIPDDSGIRVSLQCGTDDNDTLFDFDPSDLERTWSSMEFPKVAKGWRSLTEDEIAKYRKLHPSVSDDTMPKFVYNIGFDKDMQAYYPPVPAKSASLVMNGVELASERLGGDFVYSLENDSIYWFDDTWDHAPWPTNYVSRLNVPERWEARRLVLHFIRTSSTETGPVTSLRGAPGSGVRVLSCGSGDEADVGDLMIDIDPLGDVVDDDIPGYKVVKAGSGGVFRTGSVVEKIIAGSGISISRLGGSPAGQGTVVINSLIGGICGDFEEVALQNAKQDMIGMFPYIRLLGWRTGSSGNTPSAFILKFHVPYDNKDELYAVKISMNVFGTEGYVDSATHRAGVTVDYNILPDLNPLEGDGGVYASANVKDDLISPDSSRVLEIPVVSSVEGGIASYNAFDPVLIDTNDGSEQIPGKKYHALGSVIPNSAECTKYMTTHSLNVIGVRPGYTVAVRIARGNVAESRNEYTAPIGFMNMRWDLERIV